MSHRRCDCVFCWDQRSTFNVRRNPDESLRQLGRFSDGDLEAQTRELAQRLRAGQVSLLRIELAAYLGDEVSRNFLAGEGITFIGSGISSIGQQVEIHAPVGISYGERSDWKLPEGNLRVAWSLHPSHEWRGAYGSYSHGYRFTTSFQKLLPLYCQEIDPSGEFEEQLLLRILLASLYKLFELNHTLTSTSEQIEAQLRAETYAAAFIPLAFLHDSDDTQMSNLDQLYVLQEAIIEDMEADADRLYLTPFEHLLVRAINRLRNEPSMVTPLFHPVGNIAMMFAPEHIMRRELLDQLIHLVAEPYYGLSIHAFNDPHAGRDRGIINFGKGPEDMHDAIKKYVIPWVLQIADPLSHI